MDNNRLVSNERGFHSFLVKCVRIEEEEEEEEKEKEEEVKRSVKCVRIEGGFPLEKPIFSPPTPPPPTPPPPPPPHPPPPPRGKHTQRLDHHHRGRSISLVREEEMHPLKGGGRGGDRELEKKEKK